MAKKRKPMSQETKDKISRAHTGMKHSLATKLKISFMRRGKGHKHTKESKYKLSIAHSGKILSKEHRKKLSESHMGQKGYWTGKKRSKSTCNKLSIATTRNIANGVIKPGIGKIGFRKDIGCYFRSSWEANYARYLNYKGVEWTFEPCQFHLDNLGRRYMPDFILGDGTYVEIKGQDTELSRSKRLEFRKQYKHKLLVIGPKRYKEISASYSNKIDNWEK